MPNPNPRTSRVCGGLASVIVALLAIARPAPGDEPPGLVVERAARAVLNAHGEKVRAGLWVGGPKAGPLFASQADATLPTASAIKTAILVELFARFAADLDRTPPGLDDLLRDDHPTIAHFPAEQRKEARRGLSGMTVRHLGGVMMGSIPASNLVYNAAASVSIALLGGPEGTTRAIHDRDRAFAPIFVRRYMLTDRTKPGDNVATASALAAVLQRLASRRVPGLDAPTVEAVCRAVEAKDDPRRGRVFLKDGLLESDPITVVRTGWVEPAGTGEPTVFVVMLAQNGPGTRSRDEAIRDLEAVGSRLVDVLLDENRQSPR